MHLLKSSKNLVDYLAALSVFLYTSTMTTFGKVISVAVGLLIVGSIVGYLLWGKESPSVPVIETVVEEDGSTEQVYKESGDGFQISLVYPKDTDPQIQTDIQMHIFEYVDSFKENASRLYTEMKDDGVSTGFIAELTSAYSKKESSSYGMVTYLFQVHEYLGGAHGNTIVSSLSYKHGERLSFEDIVIDGDDHQDAIASAVKTKLKDMFEGELDAFWFDQSDEELFQSLGNFYLENTDIVFVFSPYDVAPYSFGIVEVPVPIPSLAGHLIFE